jgi:lysophospholipase L1-like esterase
MRRGVADAFLAPARRLTAAYQGKWVGSGLGGPVVTTMLASLTLAALVWPTAGAALARAVPRWRYAGEFTSTSGYRHEGISGAPTQTLADRVPGCLTGAAPGGRVVLVDLGTNDARLGHSAARMLTDLRALLDKLLAVPQVRVVVAQVTITAGQAPAGQRAEQDYDDGIPPLAAAYGSRASTVDMRGVHLSADRVHPDDAGYRTMAQRWFGALLATDPALRTGGR